MESLLALPLGVGIEVLVFVLLYRFTPLSGQQGAVIVVFLALAVTLPYSLVHWPGGDVLAMHIALYVVTAYVLGIIGYSRERRREQHGEGSGRWFHWGPAVIVLFFACVVLLNGVMVVLSKQGLPDALATWMLPKQDRKGEVTSVFPGTVSRDFQKKEALYNEYLEQVRAQTERGWQVRKGWLNAPQVGVPAVFQVDVQARDGSPVLGARVSGSFLRPSDKRLDQHFELVEKDTGVYRATLTLPAPGLWNLALRIERGEDVHEVHARTEVGR